MDLNDIQLLFRFNYWALKRIMEVVATLPPEEYAKDRASSHGGIRGTLVHTMGAEEIWLKRWNEETITGAAKEGDYPTFSSLAGKWAVVERDVLRFCAAMKNNGDVARVFHYKDLKGNPYSSLLAEAMQHLVNHSTYHRGQVVTMLRQAGVKPVGTDLIAFYRELHGTHAG
jgi:uncharacterized damage-inducible protein DinB